MMQFESLSIASYQSWQPQYKEGAMHGTIKYKGAHGDVTVNLTDALARKILAVVAEDMVAASREIATNLTSDVINSVPQLAAPATLVEPPAPTDIPF
jgi:hypothetical protein